MSAMTEMSRAIRLEMRQLRGGSVGSGDIEEDHVHADRLLCEAIRRLAAYLSADPTLWQAEAEELIETYESIEKWYA